MWEEVQKEEELVAFSPPILGQMRKISLRDYTTVRSAYRLFISPPHSLQYGSFLFIANECFYDMDNEWLTLPARNTSSPV